MTHSQHILSFVLVLCFGLSVRAEAEEKPKAESLSVADTLTKRKLGEPTKAEQSLLRYTNLARSEHKMPALTEVSHLTVVAQRHAINMAKQQEMNHKLDEKGVKDRLDLVEYQYAAFGENIAAGYRNPKETVKGWMKSPGHRKNLLDEAGYGFTQIGLGAHQGTNGVWYCCQVFAKPVAGKNYE